VPTGVGGAQGTEEFWEPGLHKLFSGQGEPAGGMAGLRDCLPLPAVEARAAVAWAKWEPERLALPCLPVLPFSHL
jgi:hypothetical protein